jgi:hypothetical protein
MSLIPATSNPGRPEPVHPAALPEDQLLAQCRVVRGRKGGPGGQNRNKVESAIQIIHEPTDSQGAAAERRSQGENLRVALFRLRVNLALEQRGYFTPRHAPSPLWLTRLNPHDRTFRINPDHHDFPAILAEALDLLEALRWEPARAANLLGCTASQIIRLLKLEPRALQVVNQHRQKRGEHPLR